MSCRTPPSRRPASSLLAAGPDRPPGPLPAHISRTAEEPPSMAPDPNGRSSLRTADGPCGESP